MIIIISNYFNLSRKCEWNSRRMEWVLCLSGVRAMLPNALVWSSSIYKSTQRAEYGPNEVECRCGKIVGSF